MNATSAINPEPCVYCGFFHKAVCPRVAAIEYFPDGTTKRVEFVRPQPLSGALSGLMPVVTVRDDGARFGGSMGAANANPADLAKTMPRYDLASFCAPPFHEMNRNGYR